MGRRALAAVVVGLGVALVATALPDAARAEPMAARVAPEATATDVSAQSRRTLRRAPRRVPVYRGSHDPGPNAVRLCHAYYEQEYRPSGTVIVPRMHCYWRG